MSAPRWYRGTPPWLWGAVIALALALALVGAGWATVGAIRSSERAAVLEEGDALTRAALARGDTLARAVDSLRSAVATVDTVLVTRLRTVRDTAWLPADTTPVVVLGACRAQLDTLAQDCAAFRETATTALAQATTIRRGDSTVIAGLSLQLAAIRRADSVRAAQQSRRSRLRVATDAACVGAVAAHFFR